MMPGDWLSLIDIQWIYPHLDVSALIVILQIGLDTNGLSFHAGYQRCGTKYVSSCEYGGAQQQRRRRFSVAVI